MCSIIGQRDGDAVIILDELVLPDSNTEAACYAFWQKVMTLRGHSHLPLQLHLYGDATGRGRNTAASRTDWQIVRDFFKRQFCQVSSKLPSANPLVKDRINCVNALLRNQAGERRLLIDPKCTELVLDLERVRWKSDSNGN